MPSLSIYQAKGNGLVTRPVDLVLAQHRLSMEQGAAGNVYFSLFNLSEPLGAAFRDGPYAGTVPPYHPTRREGR